MHTLAINNNEFTCIEAWDEMPLSTATKLRNTFKDCPKTLMAVYELLPKEKTPEIKAEVERICNTMTYEETVKSNPVFYGKWISILSNIPDDVQSNKYALFEEFCFKFLPGILHLNPLMEYKNISWFEFKGVKYLLPKEFKNYTGFELGVLLFDLSKGKFEVISNIIAYTCLPEGEIFNKESYLERAEIFKELPMSVVWEVLKTMHELRIINQQEAMIKDLKSQLN